MAAAERKRPWYLVLALLAALGLGAMGASSGWSMFVLYREPIDVSAEGDGIADQAERDAVLARSSAWLKSLDDAKARGWPLGVATLLLGGAVFVFAMRTLGGSNGARAALVQVVIAQAGVNVANYFLMRDVTDAYVRFFEAKQAAITHERAVDPDVIRRAIPIWVALQTIGSALVVFGVTRRRSRQFLDGLTKAVEGR
ncbi:MAG: hypothetical protein ABSC94_16945 [Polyangiaceae bacterium]|jgi:hypothetical protein